MAENGFELDRYYALALADKSEEAEYYRALVPGHIFKYLDMSIRAEWREDILRRILSCDLNRRIAEQELAADEAVLREDRAQLELAELSGNTARADQKRTQIAATEEEIRRDRERVDNADPWLRDPSFLGIRAEAAFGDPKTAKASKDALLRYLKAVAEYKLLERDRETARDTARAAADASVSAYKEQARAADLAASSAEGLRKRYEETLGRKPLAGLLRGLEDRKNAELAKAARGRDVIAADLELAKSRCTARMDLGKFDKEALKELLDAMKDYRSGLRREKADKADKAWARVADRMPDLMRPESARQIETYIDEVRAAIKSARAEKEGAQVPAQSALSSVRAMLDFARQNGALEPADRDLEIARNAAENDVSLFMPVISASGTLGLSGNILDPASFYSNPGSRDDSKFVNDNLKGSSGLSISLTIPLYDAARSDRRESGEESVNASARQNELSERSLIVRIGRQLIAIKSAADRRAGLDKRAKNTEDRINKIKERPMPWRPRYSPSKPGGRLFTASRPMPGSVSRRQETLSGRYLPARRQAR